MEHINKRYFMQLSYNGSAYNGWQIQPNAPTVQEVLSKALSTILRQDINVIGCGRTDSGVHAKDFMAHFDADIQNITTNKLCFKLNSFLPKDIAIYNIFEVHPEAHTRFNATARTYKYYIDTEKNPFTNEYAHLPYPIPDINLMNSACKILFNYTDFTSFSKLHTDVKTNNCTIYEAYWTKKNHQLIFTIKADRFLRNMVRAIVGTLISVGNKKLNINELKYIIESKNRNNAGISVPGKALFLYKIDYPEEVFNMKLPKKNFTKQESTK